MGAAGMEINKEKKIELYPRPLSIKGTETIIEQMKKCVCKIYLKEGIKGSGFFCKISYNNNNIPVIITNSHIISSDYVKNNKIIKITLNNVEEDKTIEINDNRLIYSNEEYDGTIIGLNPDKDKISNFMELDERIYKEKSDIFFNKESVYIIHYANGDNVLVSYGIIHYLGDYNISHLCYTQNGSSGSPIINITNNKIIGIHKEASKSFNMNFGTFLKNPIEDFINKYMNEKKDFKNYFKDSKIIKKIEDINFITSAIEKKMHISNMKMIYQATKHGDKSEDFKKYCNNKGPTLTMIKSENYEIFGGFTKCDWTNDNFAFSNDKDAFLYSITNKKIFDVIEPEKAIINYDRGYAFACFGNTNDWDGIYLFDGFLTDSQGYCNPKKLTNVYNLEERKISPI